MVFRIHFFKRYVAPPTIPPMTAPGIVPLVEQTANPITAPAIAVAHTLLAKKKSLKVIERRFLVNT